MSAEKIAEMPEGKDKELLKVLHDGSYAPFVRKCDGYGVKVEEDKEISYKDFNDQENVLKVPKGSYIVVESDMNYPKILSAEEFKSKYDFIKKDEPASKKSGPTLSITNLSD